MESFLIRINSGYIFIQTAKQTKLHPEEAACMASFCPECVHTFFRCMFFCDQISQNTSKTSFVLDLWDFKILHLKFIALLFPRCICLSTLIYFPNFSSVQVYTDATLQQQRSQQCFYLFGLTTSTEGKSATKPGTNDLQPVFSSLCRL